MHVRIEASFICFEGPTIFLVTTARAAPWASGLDLSKES
jgi:hypothetical protein